ncbi:hypothetical protein BKA70DRAFT_1138682 [Coprinopsis sp. MPI-PUGE-AT-0042]|nr:hypothetical protein BKA70DRAFT_1138682 [Coprinopsis sp. MPI-PUGE-AT-0042]
MEKAHVLITRSASTLALSDDAGVECILTGIPLLCIGILSLGVFTFILATRRTSILISLLFASCFFGFVAAIIDLGQILLRGYASVNGGLELGQAVGLIQGREVFLSFSVGFLYLFYWFFSSRRPHALAVAPDMGAIATEKADPTLATRMTSARKLHCASWERWGYVGITLKWASLVTCFLILILQLVWRLTKKHHFYGDLYVASATLETAISIVFILKLILNSYLAESTSRRQVLLGYIAPVFAFVLSAGMGIGSLVVFAFSETSLGRFLRGVEAYTLLIYYLIITFRSASHDGIPPPYKAPGVDIYVPQEKSGSEGAYQQTILPYASVARNAAANPSTEAIWQLSRVSHISRISSWVESRRASRKSLGGDNANLPQSPPIRSLLFQQPASASPSNGSDSSGKSFVSPPPPVPQSNRSSMNFFSYYGLDRTGKSTGLRDDTSTIGSDSPIYGLNGIIVPPKKTQPSKLAEMSLGGPSGEVTPVRMTRLIEAQADIDESINALRTQADGDKTNQEPKEGGLTAERLKAAHLTPDLGALTSESSKPSSPANVSEFSLSVFPEPPAPALVSPTSLRELGPRSKVARPSAAKRVPPISVIPIQVEDLVRDSNVYDSPLSGTRYDVTSFIGGYALPSSAFPSSSAINSSTGVLPSGSMLSDIPESTARETPGRLSPTGATNANSQYVTLTRTSSRPLGSATMSSSLNKADSPSGDVPTQNLALRTFLARNETTRSRMTAAPSGPF